MRTEFERLGTETRHAYRARVAGFGSRCTWFGMYPVEMILLANVIHLVSGREVTDHVWFTLGKSWEGYEVGDWVEFKARVGEYLKGRRKEIPDYKLSNPSKIRRIELTPQDLAAMKEKALAEYEAKLANWKMRKEAWDASKQTEVVNVKRLPTPLPHQDIGTLVPNWCKNKGRDNTWEFFGVVSHRNKTVQVKCKRPRAFPDRPPNRPRLNY